MYFGAHEPLVNKDKPETENFRKRFHATHEVYRSLSEWIHCTFLFSTSLSLNKGQSAFSLPLMQHVLRGIPPTVWRSPAWNCEKRWIIITWRANRADQVHTRTKGKWVSPTHFFFLCLTRALFFLPAFFPPYSCTRVDGVSEKLCSLIYIYFFLLQEI